MNNKVAFVLSAVVAEAAILAGVTKSRAEVIYPWCVQYGSSFTGINSTDCSFNSFEQCMATARGLGAFCVQNPAYPSPTPKSRRPRGL
jgi:hypothetical protein